MTPPVPGTAVPDDCICGEINARHCPVHNDPMTGDEFDELSKYRDAEAEQAWERIARERWAAMCGDPKQGPTLDFRDGVEMGYKAAAKESEALIGLADEAFSHRTITGRAEDGPDGPSATTWYVIPTEFVDAYLAKREGKA